MDVKRRSPLGSILLVVTLLFGSAGATAQVIRMPSRAAPTASALRDQLQAPVADFAQMATDYRLDLPPPSAAERVTARSVRGPGQAAFGRAPAGGAKVMDVPAGVRQVRLSITSQMARQLRVGLAFDDSKSYSIAAWSPGDQNAVLMASNGSRGFGHIVWTPVTTGATQEIVVTRDNNDGNPWSVTVAKVSHFDTAVFGGGTDFAPDIYGEGTALSCQMDIACVVQSANPSVQQPLSATVSAVAMLILTYTDGTSWACTGTLLNTTSYPSAIVITASHCVAGESGTETTSSLASIWFFQRPSCGSTALASYVQLVSVPTLLWNDVILDGALLNLNHLPPAAAKYAAWDANVIAEGADLLAIHHPKADVKKGGFAQFQGTNQGPISTGTITHPPGTFYVVNWTLGLVEPGSSGSGVFTTDSSGENYLRGTLTGSTPSETCSTSPNLSYYGQLASMYPDIQKYLAGGGLNYEGLWWAAPAGVESGWGINFAHQGDTIFATWFTYGQNGKGLWVIMPAPKTADGQYGGTLYTTTGPAFSAVPFEPSQVVEQQVGSGSITFTDANNGTFAYTLNGVTQTKAITRQVFGPLPTCGTATGPLTAATNYQDLWWAAPAGVESGWGINLTHQGDTIFATWFTYAADHSQMWLVVSAPKTAPGVYSGNVDITTGPPFSAVPFNPANVTETTIGNATFTFSDGNNATFAYTVNGVTQSKAITREVFVPPGTVCQ
jgi:hypothetical protein